MEDKVVGQCVSCGLTTTRPQRLRVLEWIGCGLGLAGAYLLAFAFDGSRYGWVAFLLANIAVIAFARGIRAYGLLTQQLGFMGSSLLGLYHAFWPHG